MLTFQCSLKLHVVLKDIAFLQINFWLLLLMVSCLSSRNFDSDVAAAASEQPQPGAAARAVYNIRCLGEGQKSGDDSYISK
jgi:hypothetical protein